MKSDWGWAYGLHRVCANNTRLAANAEAGDVDALALFAHKFRPADPVAAILFIAGWYGGGELYDKCVYHEPKQDGEGNGN